MLYTHVLRHYVPTSLHTYLQHCHQSTITWGIYVAYKTNENVVLISKLKLIDFLSQKVTQPLNIILARCAQGKAADFK